MLFQIGPMVLVKPQRPKLDPIRNPTLFQMGKLEEAGELAHNLRVERPYFDPGVYLGTSAFTATGWEGSFYPRRTGSRAIFFPTICRSF